MLVWLMITLVLAFLSIFELLLNFSAPFPELRIVILFLLVVGMAYRLLTMERGGEKEKMVNRIRELEGRIRELDMGEGGK